MSHQWKLFKQRYYRNLNILILCRPVLLSGNVQSEHDATGEIEENDIIVTLTILASVGQCYFQVTSNLKCRIRGNVSYNDIIRALTV